MEWKQHMRREVQELLNMGPLPPEDVAEIETVEKYEKLLLQISQTLTNDEANNLISLFGSDSFFGLAWIVIDLIESAPGWPNEIILPNVESEWIELLNRRAAEE